MKPTRDPPKDLEASCLLWSSWINAASRKGYMKLRTKLYLVTLLPKSKVIPKVVKKNVLSKLVPSHLNTKKIIKKCTKVLALSLLKSESEPINAYFKNNKAMHRDYLKVTKEHVATLLELLEEVRALKLLDEHIGHASKVSSTNASRSKPRSNTKNDKIPQPSNRSMKNKVEAHHRKFKSSANKNCHVLDCNENVKNVALSKNSDTICLSCNECLFSANHDACVIIEIVLWYLYSGCSKHMTGHRDKLINIVSKFIRTIRFSNDHFAAIMGYGDLQMGNILISRVYYVEGIGWTIQTLLWRNTSGSRKKKLENVGKCLTRKLLSMERSVSSLNDEIDFRVSFDDSDDEDYTPTICCFDDLDFFKDFENEFPAIVYNDAQTSKLDLLTELNFNPQHINEFDINDDTSLFEYDEEEQKILYFNDLFPLNIIRPDDLKSEKDNNDNDIDII
ncbi:hypothetical protein Tco_0480328 [Tanacetum coccineum]